LRRVPFTLSGVRADARNQAAIFGPRGLKVWGIHFIAPRGNSRTDVDRAEAALIGIVACKGKCVREPEAKCAFASAGISV